MRIARATAPWTSAKTPPATTPSSAAPYAEALVRHRALVRALMGSLVIGTVANGIDLLGYSSAIKYMATGLILLAAVTLDTVSRRRLARSGR